MKSIGVLILGQSRKSRAGKTPHGLFDRSRDFCHMTHWALNHRTRERGLWGRARIAEKYLRELIQGWSGSVRFLLWFSHCFQSSPKASRDAAVFQTICASIVTLKTVQANRIVWIEAVVGENLRLSTIKFHLMYLTVFILVITVINWWAKRKLRQDIC